MNVNIKNVIRNSDVMIQLEPAGAYMREPKFGILFNKISFF